MKLSFARFSAGAWALAIRDDSLVITGFSASCTPLGNCQYGFFIGAIKRSATLAGAGGIPPVTAGTCSNSGAVSWTSTKQSDSGFQFKVAEPLRGTLVLLSYCHVIPGSDIATENDGATQVKHYTGPANLTAATAECSSWGTGPPLRATVGYSS